MDIPKQCNFRASKEKENFKKIDWLGYHKRRLVQNQPSKEQTMYPISNFGSFLRKRIISAVGTKSGKKSLQHDTPYIIIGEFTWKKNTNCKRREKQGKLKNKSKTTIMKFAVLYHLKKPFSL